MASNYLKRVFIKLANLPFDPNNPVAFQIGFLIIPDKPRMTEPETAKVIDVLCFHCNKGKKKGESIKTQIKEPVIKQTSNNRTQATGKCSVCDKPVSTFIKKDKAPIVASETTPDPSKESDK